MAIGYCWPSRSTWITSENNSMSTPAVVPLAASEVLNTPTRFAAPDRHLYQNAQDHSRVSHDVLRGTTMGPVVGPEIEYEAGIYFSFAVMAKFSISRLRRRGFMRLRWRDGVRGGGGG